MIRQTATVKTALPPITDQNTGQKYAAKVSIELIPLLTGTFDPSSSRSLAPVSHR
jgi:hypothetical protein